MKYFLLMLIILPLRTNGQTVKKYTELLTIGSNENASDEYILGAPQKICVDSKKNIFVYDESVKKIRKYNKEGKFISNIGRRGKGPGEFIDIDAMVISSGDTLIIFDTQGSMITFFSASGRYLSSEKMNFNEIMWPRKILKFGESNYVFSFVRENSSYNIYVTDREFNIKCRIGKKQLPELFADKVDLLIESFTGGSLAANRNELFYTPYAYEGIIYKMYPQKETPKPQIIKGSVNKREAYVLVNSDGSYKPEQRPYSMQIFAGRNKYQVKFNNESRGLFCMKDGSLIHFSLVRNGKEKIFGYERFDKTGKLISYNILHKSRIIDERPTDIPVYVECKDTEDNFYLIDKTALPVIRKIKLN